MVIDFIFTIIIVIAIFKGYRKGLVLAIFSILAFIIGLAAALKLSAFVADKLKDNMSISYHWLPFISFVVVFFIVVLLVNLGARLIQKSFDVVLLGWANKLSGAILYIILYLIVFSIFLFYLEKSRLIKPETIASSKTYSFVAPLAPKVIDNFGKIIPFFKDMFSELENFFAALPQKTQ
jgi:membrane protein required for colicin V production